MHVSTVCTRVQERNIDIFLPMGPFVNARQLVYQIHRLVAIKFVFRHKLSINRSSRPYSHFHTFFFPFFLKVTRTNIFTVSISLSREKIAELPARVEEKRKIGYVQWRHASIT